MYNSCLWNFAELVLYRNNRRLHITQRFSEYQFRLLHDNGYNVETNKYINARAASTAPHLDTAFSTGVYPVPVAPAGRLSGIETFSCA